MSNRAKGNAPVFLGVALLLLLTLAGLAALSGLQKAFDPDNTGNVAYNALKAAKEGLMKAFAFAAVTMLSIAGALAGAAGIWLGWPLTLGAGLAVFVRTGGLRIALNAIRKNREHEQGTDPEPDNPCPPGWHLGYKADPKTGRGEYVCLKDDAA